MGQTTIRSVWESLPNWHKAKKEGFPLYRVTNDTFMDEVRQGGNSLYIYDLYFINVIVLVRIQFQFTIKMNAL